MPDPRGAAPAFRRRHCRKCERLAAAYRGDLDEVHRLQGWAAQHYQRNIALANVILGLCFTGLAARMQLDLVEAETCYRKALKIAKRSGGSRSHTARLASSLLGELLYERGDLDEAESLLDEGYKLGPKVGRSISRSPAT